MALREAATQNPYSATAYLDLVRALSRVRLTKKQAQAAELWLSNYDTYEISAILRISRWSVRDRLRRVIRKLLEELNGTEDDQ